MRKYLLLPSLFTSTLSSLGRAQPAAAASCSTSSFSSVCPPPGTEITALTAAVVNDYFEIIDGEANNWLVGNITGLDFCQVNVTLTHPGTGDSVNNQVWLPLKEWNGRFLGVGGGGYAAGTWGSMGPAVQRGYAAVSTDAGHTQENSGDASSWALVSPGNVNQYLLLDFASRSVHDMTIVGKAITATFYSTPPAYSYWQGCSTGGRQGLGEAQMYPDDYDGIVSAAPAIQWNDFTPAQQWPYVVMNNEGYAPSQCEFTAINAAVISACDAIDGVTDGIISAPGLCHFNLHSLAGQTYNCSPTDNTTYRFSTASLTVASKIYAGPACRNGSSLWYGITPGTNFSALAPTNSSGPLPFSISDSWFKNFLLKDASYDTANVSYAQFVNLFHQGHQQYDSVIGTADADLSAFKARGGKMLTWQGLADNLIMPNGTMTYYDRVSGQVPDVQDFYRAFFAPGVGHCGGGPGVIPDDILASLRAWVENDTVPQTLPATSQWGGARKMDLCPYPRVSKYRGTGDPSLASSFECADTFDEYPLIAEKSA